MKILEHLFNQRLDLNPDLSREEINILENFSCYKGSLYAKEIMTKKVINDTIKMVANKEFTPFRWRQQNGHK